MPAPFTINTDKLAPYPELLPVRSAAARANWPELRAAYAALTSWALRTAAVDIVGETRNAEQFLAPLAEDERETLARCMLARRQVKIGWEVRTAARAQHVSAQQFATFHHHLRQAEQLLIDVTAREPENAAAWTTRVMTVRGLGLGLSEAQRRWARTACHEPHHLDAQRQLLQYLCPKWSHGPWERVHAFAEERTYSAPPGSLNGQLVVEAHLEHYDDLEVHREAMLYLRSPEVQSSITRAAAHSVLNNGFVPFYGWTGAHSWFALYWSLAGNPGAAAVHFRALGPYPAVEVWDRFYGDPHNMMLAHRNAALSGAR